MAQSHRSTSTSGSWSHTRSFSWVKRRGVPRGERRFSNGKKCVDWSACWTEYSLRSPVGCVADRKGRAVLIPVRCSVHRLAACDGKSPNQNIYMLVFFVMYTHTYKTRMEPWDKVVMKGKTKLLQMLNLELIILKNTDYIGNDERRQKKRRRRREREIKRGRGCVRVVCFCEQLWRTYFSAMTVYKWWIWLQMWFWTSVDKCYNMLLVVYLFALGDVRETKYADADSSQGGQGLWNEGEDRHYLSCGQCFSMSMSIAEQCMVFLCRNSSKGPWFQEVAVWLWKMLSQVAAVC